MFRASISRAGFLARVGASPGVWLARAWLGARARAAHPDPALLADQRGRAPGGLRCSLPTPSARQCAGAAAGSRRVVARARTAQHGSHRHPLPPDPMRASARRCHRCLARAAAAGVGRMLHHRHRDRRRARLASRLSQAHRGVIAASAGLDPFACFELGERVPDALAELAALLRAGAGWSRSARSASSTIIRLAPKAAPARPPGRVRAGRRAHAARDLHVREAHATACPARRAPRARGGAFLRRRMTAPRPRATWRSAGNWRAQRHETISCTADALYSGGGARP